MGLDVGLGDDAVVALGTEASREAVDAVMNDWVRFICSIVCPLCYSSGLCCCASRL